MDDSVSITVNRALAVAVAGVVGLAASGCGSQDETKPPEFESPSVTCEDVGDDDIDGPAVQQVSVGVSDPDRDLVTERGQLCGTLNGLPIALGDSDGDGTFTWEPSKELDDNPCGGDIDFGDQRFACNGVFEIQVTAEDASGNSEQLEIEIEKGDSS